MIHHQIYYEFPLHYAVRGGHVEAVKLLLAEGTNPGWSHFRYSSWQKLLPMAKTRGHVEVHEVLRSEMKRRFNYDPDYQPLFESIGQNADFDSMRRTISEQPKLIHAGDEHGNRAIHWAILARRISMIEFLLDAGADIHARRADLQTPLHLSMLGRDYWFESSDNPEPDVKASTVTDYLLERGADYEFSLAVKRGDRKRIDEVLAEDPSAATRLNESRRSPLGIAAEAGQIEIVKLLLELGADPNQPEECCPRGAALINVCWRQDIPLATLLLEHGADPRGISDSSGDCFSAAQHRPSERTEEFLQLLSKFISRRAAWQIPEDDNEGLLEWMRTDDSIASDDETLNGLLERVVRLSDTRVLGEFVQRFGDELIRTIDPAKGWNMIQDPQFLDELIRHGLNINRPDWFGRTYLHWCAEKKDGMQTAGHYLDRGADINAIDFMTGTTALGVAALKGNVPMVEFLLQRGADASLPADEKWARPLYLAKANGHQEVADCLRSEGAKE